jgi:signal transduction histidine kinase
MMGSPLDRRGLGAGRSGIDGHPDIRGLLHDLGHEVTTLSYLVEAVRGEGRLPPGSAQRMDLLSAEMARLLEIVRHGLSALETSERSEPVRIREMAADLASLTELSQGVRVTVAGQDGVVADVSPVVLWRVLSNVVGNAARAAGPAGHVQVSVVHRGAAVIDIVDDGPGFGAGPPGMASLGLEVVASLLRGCGGSLEMESRPGGGSLVRVLVPGRAAANAGSAPAGQGQ